MNILSIEELKKLQSFNSPTISNAIEAFKVRDNTDGYSSVALKCLTPKLKPMVGYAITCTVDSATPGHINLERYDKFIELLDLIYKSPKPAIIVYKNVSPDPFRCCATGDMVVKAFQKIGVSGIVTDCGIRDLSGICKNAKGFQIFSTGLVVSHGNYNFIDIGTTVSICGLVIKPGDLLHGDENGLLKIPIELIEIKSLLDKAKEVADRENSFFNFLESNSYNFEELKKYYFRKKFNR